MSDRNQGCSMSKITFRADDELVDRLEALDGSKSEIMRQALRSYLDARQESARNESAARRTVDEPSLDELVAERVDAVIEQRFHDHGPAHSEPSREPGRDVNVNVTVDRGDADVNAEENHQNPRNRTSADLSERQSRLCPQCGEAVAGDYVYCPNCGEKASNRAFCECGDEIRPDWAYCPSCGRQTPSADVLDRS
jgi:RNA polymerase subunit RPABC4/transcription elongation factor Spt4/Arc/MetJ-type ribon-helix-helix transcriptional regulator